MDAGPILTFSGGLLAFAAAALPILIRLWRRAVARGTHQSLIGLSLVLISAIFYIGAFVARFAYRSYALASVLLLLYLAFGIFEFVRRPGQASRGEIVGFVLLVVGAVYLLTSFVQEAGRPRPAKDPQPPQTTNASNQAMQRTADRPYA